MATSFYNDKDEPIADALVKILLECGQEVPDFLESLKPADGEALLFDDDSGSGDDDDGDDGTGDSGNGTANDGDAWGSEKPVAAAPVVENNNWDAGHGKGGL